MTVNASVSAAHVEKKVKPLFGWLIFRRISLPISLRVARTRVRPWMITAAGVAVGAAGGALLGIGTYRWAVAGAVLANAGQVFDAMDGEVARAQGTGSAGGYVADCISDRLRDLAIVLGAGIGAARMGSGWAMAWTLGAVAGYQFFFYLSGVSPAHWREARGAADLPVKHMFAATTIRIGIGDTLAVAALGTALAGRPLALVQVVAVGSAAGIALKVRHLLRLRPWAAEPAERRAEPA